MSGAAAAAAAAAAASVSDQAAASSFLTRAISKPLNADHCPEYRLRIQEATAQGKTKNLETLQFENLRTKPNEPQIINSVPLC